MPGGALDDRIKPGHVAGRGQYLLLVGLRNGRLDAAQFAEAVEETVGDALKLLHRSRQHRVGRGARGEGARDRFAQQQYLGEQFRTRLVDVAMDQVLQAAGFALQQRQNLVRLPYLPDVVPGRTEHLSAVPYHGGQHHDDRRVQRGNRQDAPADRHRAEQPDDAGTASGGEARRPFRSFVLPGGCQDRFTPPCECDRSVRHPRDIAEPSRGFPLSRLRTVCGLRQSRSWRRRESASGRQPFRDQAAHVTPRLYGRIILAAGIGGAKFPRNNARRDGRQIQPNEQCYDPRKVGAAVHRQRPLMMRSMARGKGSTFCRSRRVMSSRRHH